MQAFAKMESARLITIIEVKAVIGTGTKEDPSRVITQYWDFEGNLLSQVDPTKDGVLLEQRGQY